MKLLIRTINYKKLIKATPDYLSSTIVKTLMVKSNAVSNKSSTFSVTRRELLSTKSISSRKRMENRIHPRLFPFSLEIEFVLRLLTQLLRGSSPMPRMWSKWMLRRRVPTRLTPTLWTLSTQSKERNNSKRSAFLPKSMLRSDRIKTPIEKHSSRKECVWLTTDCTWFSIIMEMLMVSLWLALFK